MPLEKQLVRRSTEMLQAIDRIHTAIGRSTADELFLDWQKTWIVERGFEIISEASRSIPIEIKLSYGDIPWIDIASLGNILRHRYWRSDINTLWETALWDLPDLRTALQDILRHDGEAS